MKAALQRAGRPAVAVLSRPGAVVEATGLATGLARGLGAILALLLAGCTVGPEFVRPEPVLPAELGAGVELPATTLAVPKRGLWSAFGDETLDTLLSTALDRNRGLAQALARLDEARALSGLERYTRYPIVTSASAAERAQPSPLDPFIPPGVGRIDTYRLGFDALWEIDLFGRARRTQESLVAQAEAAAADVEAARVVLLGEVAQAYLTLRAEQARLAVQTRQIENLQQNLKLLELLRDEGRGTELDVARSHALGLAIAARLPATEAAIARQEQRLAVLTALPTADLRAVLGPPRGLPVLPELLPLDEPEQWLRRRPDVAAAERRLAAATAEIGVAIADYFPQLELTGSFGWTAQSPGDLGNSAAERYRFGPSLSWSFLDFNRVRQRVLAAEARAAGALAAYEEALLLALEEVEASLTNWRAANRSAAALELAVTRARDAEKLARLRFEVGAADTLVVLDAERTTLDLEDQLASARATRATALAALYKALAGDFAVAPGP